MCVCVYIYIISKNKYMAVKMGYVILYYIQNIFQASLMFPDILWCFLMFPNAPRFWDAFISLHDLRVRMVLAPLAQSLWSKGEMKKSIAASCSSSMRQCLPPISPSHNCIKGTECSMLEAYMSRHMKSSCYTEFKQIGIIVSVSKCCNWETRSTATKSSVLSPIVGWPV